MQRLYKELYDSMMIYHRSNLVVRGTDKQRSPSQLKPFGRM